MPSEEPDHGLARASPDESEMIQAYFFATFCTRRPLVLHAALRFVNLVRSDIMRKMADDEAVAWLSVRRDVYVIRQEMETVYRNSGQEIINGLVDSSLWRDDYAILQMGGRECLIHTYDWTWWFAKTQ